MNPLTQYIFENDLDHDKAMNKLQQHALVSDNAVTSENVAGVDQDRAVEALPTIYNEP